MFLYVYPQYSLVVVEGGRDVVCVAVVEYVLPCLFTCVAKRAKMGAMPLPKMDGFGMTTAPPRAPQHSI